MSKRTYETAAEVRKIARPETGQVEWYDALAPRLDPPVPGLGIRISSKGTKSFTLNYRFYDKVKNKRVARRDTIGRFSEVHGDYEELPQWHPRCALTVKQSRKVAERMLALVEAGIDPRGVQKQAEDRQKQDRANLYSKAVDFYVDRYHVQTKQNKSAELTRARLLRVNPEWHDRPVGGITQEEIQDVLDEVMDRDQIYEANRRYSALRHFFAWLKKRKLIPENPTIDIDRPSDGETSRKRYWTKDELAAIWKAGDQLDAKHAAWLRIMILTGARPNEVAGMRKAELDLENGLWTVPPERHKTGKRTDQENIYELPTLAIRILKGLLKTEPTPKGSQYVFWGEGTRDGKPNHITLNTRLRARIKTLSEVDDYYDYAARHTFATGLKDEVKAPPYVIEACMHHRPKGTTAGYVHGSYRGEIREACEAWAQHIERLVYPDGVVGLHG